MNDATTKKIKYPYIPEGWEMYYVPADNQFIQAAKKFAREHSLDKTMPNASVIVKDGEIIGQGANGSDYHDTHECERVKRGSKSGEDYELCEGCHPKNHSEPSAIRDAKEKGNATTGAELYLWGHFWCCEPCWDAMIAAGITKVYLVADSEKLFNKNHPENIVGKQFD